MEKNNGGVISVLESREQIDKIKTFYKDEYQKIKDEQKEQLSEYRKNKWKITFGSLGIKAGLTFSPKPIKIFGKIFTNIFSAISKKVIDIKEKIYKRKVEKRLKKLDADFMNLDGEFRAFSIDNYATVEELEDEKVEDVAFAK